MPHAPTPVAAPRNGQVELGQKALDVAGSTSMGPLRYGGIAGTWLGTDIPLDTLNRMRLTDETVQAALSFYSQVIQTKFDDYYNERHPDAEQFIRAVFGSMHPTFLDGLAGLLSAPWAGFAVSEPVYNLIASGDWAGHIGCQRLKALHPVSVYKIHIDAHGNFLDHGAMVSTPDNPGSFEQRTPTISAPVRLPSGKVVYWRYQVTGHFDNPTGESALRAAYRSWYTKDMLIKWWNMYLERHGSPIVHVEVPSGGTVKDPATGQSMDMVKAYTLMMADLPNRSSIVNQVQPANRIPGGGGGDMLPKISLIESQSRSAVDYEQAARFHSNAILLALGIPPLILLEPEHASRAQGVTHMETVMLRIEGIIEQLRSALQVGLVQKLLDMNFAGVQDYGELRWHPVEEEDLTALSDLVYRLQAAGAYNFQAPAARAWLQSKAGIPPEQADEAAQPEADEEPVVVSVAQVTQDERPEQIA